MDFWRREKSPPLPEFELRTVQHIASVLSYLVALQQEILFSMCELHIDILW